MEIQRKTNLDRLASLQLKKVLLLLLLVLSLSACSNTKDGITMLGSLGGMVYATSKGENVLLGSIAGGAIGNIMGQAVVTQVQVND